jgi:hypothetical protein
MAATPLPTAPRKPWKVVVVVLIACVAVLAAGIGLLQRFMGAFMAYSPAQIRVDGREALERRRARLTLGADEYSRWVNLADIAFWSVDAGDLVKAVEYADEAMAMLPAHRNDWNYGNVIHKANLARGRVALRLGQPKAAAGFLLAAGATPGSPQLNSFGPNMLLAKELLLAGERDAVLAYIDACARFWQLDAGAIWAWKRIINAGGIPNFGAHLMF